MKRSLREITAWHERYEDWRAAMLGILEHELGHRLTVGPITEAKWRRAWQARTTPWRLFGEHHSNVRGSNISIDEIPVLGES